MGVRVNPTDKDTLGIFEEVPPGFKKISEAFNILSAGTRENFGVLGFKWLEYLTANAKAVKAQAELFARRFDEKAPKEIGAQQSRELNRFKLCAVAGEIATKAALTGWQEGQATAAVIRLMERYFEGLITGTKEARRLIERLRKPPSKRINSGFTARMSGPNTGIETLICTAFLPTQKVTMDKRI